MKTFLNFLKHNRLYTAINLVGLALSMAFILLLAVYVQKQLNTDSFQEKADRIILVANEFYASAYHLQDYLIERYPEIESTTGFLTENNVELKLREETLYSSVNFADSTFFDIFSFKVIEGDKESFRHSRNNIVVSKSFASQYFGSEDAIGKTLTMSRYDDQLTITAVMEDIDNSVIPYCDILIRGEWMEIRNDSHNKHLGNSGTVQTFVLVKENADLMAKEADMLEYFKEIWWMYKGYCSKVFLLPMKDIYFCGCDEISCLNTGNKSFVNLLLTVCLVLLLFAMLNYINLTTAIIGFRAKEMASRRLLGASKANIFLKMTGESTIMCTTAAIAAIFIAEGLSPYVSGFLGYNFSISGAISPGNIAAVVLSVLLLGILSGTIPAVTLLTVQPIDIVRGSFRLKTKTIYSKVIMFIQNTLTLCLLIMAITMTLQIRHMLDAPLGYNTKNILNIENNYGPVSKLNVAKEQMLTETFVKNVGYGHGTPLWGTNNETSRLLNDDWISFQVIQGDNGYFDILGLRKKEDRNIPDSFWVNEYAMELISAANKQLGIKDSESTIPFANSNSAIIGGVYHDFKIFSLLQDQSAALIRNLGTYGDNKSPWNILVEIEGDHAEAYSRIRDIFAEVFPDKIFDAEYIEDQISRTFIKEKKALDIVIIFTIISIMISALGLLAMSTYFMLQQRKNAAIRKVIGADMKTVLKELIMSFMKYVCAATVIGIPAGWYMAHRWLEGFSYRIQLHWWIFALSALTILAIALVTILWQSLKASATNPTEALKSE